MNAVVEFERFVDTMNGVSVGTDNDELEGTTHFMKVWKELPDYLLSLQERLMESFVRLQEIVDASELV